MKEEIIVTLNELLKKSTNRDILDYSTASKKLKKISNCLTYIYTKRGKIFLFFTETHGMGERYYVREDDIKRVLGDEFKKYTLIVEEGLEKRFERGQDYVIRHGNIYELA